MRDGVSNAPLTRNDMIHTYSWNVLHILVSQYFLANSEIESGNEKSNAGGTTPPHACRASVAFITWRPSKRPRTDEAHDFCERQFGQDNRTRIDN